MEKENFPLPFGERIKVRGGLLPLVKGAGGIHPACQAELV
jgi:hypothetical protein